MAFPVMSLASGANRLGESQKLKAEGSGSWDPLTGKWKNQGNQEAWSNVGAFAAPHKVLFDENLTGGEKAMALLNPAMTPLITRRRSQRMEDERVKALESVYGALALTPKYERSEEAGQLRDVYSKGAETTRGIGEDIVSISESIASKGRPGSQIQRAQVKQYAQAAIDDVAETGGASSAALGAVVAARTNQMRSLMNIATEDAEYKRQAQSSYMNSLLRQSSIESQATGMEAAGLQSGVTEAGKEYMGRMEQVMPALQFQLTQLGNVGAQNQVNSQNNGMAFAQLASAAGQALAQSNFGGGGQGGGFDQAYTTGVNVDDGGGGMFTNDAVTGGEALNPSQGYGGYY